MTASSSSSPDIHPVSEVASHPKHDNHDDDPYLWLENVDSTESLDWCRAANEACLKHWGHPEQTETYARILQVLQSDDRIPHVTQYGRDPKSDRNEPVLYNFWKDAKNVKGLWRKTTMSSYQSAETKWTTVLDLDQLAEKDGISWVWSGSTALPRSRDVPVTPETQDYAGKLVTRSLVSLSRGGSDATHVKEFDHLTGDFVTDQPFVLPEAKTRVSYKSRNVLIVGTNTGPDSLTDSGYPRTVREWVRGTPLEEAPIVFEGEATDVSVYAYIADERVWQGRLYEVRGRSLTFYTSKHWIRKIEPEHLLAPEDPLRRSVPEPLEFSVLDVPEDANISFQGKLLMIFLRSDWEPVTASGTVYKKGSLIYTLLDDFITLGKQNVSYNVLFEPTDRTAYEYFTITKNYLILATMDTVQSKLDFYKIGSDGATLTPVSTYQSQARIRDCSVQPVDPYDGSDEFWFTTSDFLTPSTLYLANAARVEQAPAMTSAATAEAATTLPLHEDDCFIEEKLKSLPEQYKSSNLEVAQQFAISKDGTEIPYFIIAPKDAPKDGTNPTLLYGYGGFEVSLGPSYIAVPGLAWLERGGVYVMANIRGGGEFGPSWHQAALKEKRHKCYEDFIAVAEHLIQTGICQPKSLAIRGGSNVSHTFL